MLFAVIEMTVGQVDQERYVLIVFCNGLLMPLPGRPEITGQSKHRADQIQHDGIPLFSVDGIDQAALRFDKFTGCDEQAGQLCPGCSMRVIEAHYRFQRLLRHVAIAAFECNDGGKVMRPGHVGPLSERFATQVGGQLLIAVAKRRKTFFNKFL